MYSERLISLRSFLSMDVVISILAILVLNHLPQAINMLIRVIQRHLGLLRGIDRPRELTQSSALVCLPVELQTEILVSLTWKDVLAVRMTCEWFSMVTNSRAIWAHLVQEHVANHPSPPRLERPIGMYTSSELKRLFLHWKRIDATFSGQCTEPVRACRFTSEKSTWSSHLVEGGRWLLNVDYAGAVTYYDLDANMITETPLISARISYQEHNSVGMSVHYDSQSSILKFTLALFLTDELYKTKYSGWFYIWSIALLLDSSNSGVGLVATLLATFPLHRTIECVRSLSLFGHYLAFNGFKGENDLTDWQVYVVDWQKANGTSDIYPWRIVQKCIYRTGVYLLAGAQIMVIGRRTVDLYCYLNTKEATDTVTPGPPARSWSHSFGCVMITFYSQRLYSRTTTRFVLIVEGNYHVLDIQNDPLSNVLPSMTKLVHDVPHPVVGHLRVGYSRAIRFNKSDPVELLQYSPKSSPNISCHIFFPFDPSLSLSLLSMDEHRGRIVIPTVIPERLSVLIDLAPSYKIQTL